jgi:hypothetical protein
LAKTCPSVPEAAVQPEFQALDADNVRLVVREHALARSQP